MFITNDYARQNIPDFWEHAYLECRDRSTCTLCSSTQHNHTRGTDYQDTTISGEKIVGKNLREKYLKSNFPAVERDERERETRSREKTKK